MGLAAAWTVAIAVIIAMTGAGVARLRRRAGPPQGVVPQAAARETFGYALGRLVTAHSGHRDSKRDRTSSA